MSFLPVVDCCDNFPQNDFESHEAWESAMSQLWRFLLPGDDRVFGFLVASTVSRMPWTSEFELNHSERTVRMLPENGLDISSSSTLALDRLLKAAQNIGAFKKLSNWPGEKFPLLGAPFPFAIDRAIAPYLGIVSTGVQLTIFERAEGASIRGIWIARRGLNKATYPEMLDNAVGGAIEHGEMPFASLVREAKEELGIDASVAISGGTVSWFNIKAESSGLHPGLVEPGVQYVYDMEVSSDVVLQPAEEGIDWLRLMSIDEVKSALLRREFKPSCACVMLDFFVRHGIINAENEPCFAELVPRLHRRLLLPTAFPSTTA